MLLRIEAQVADKDADGIVPGPEVRLGEVSSRLANEKGARVL